MAAGAPRIRHTRLGLISAGLFVGEVIQGPWKPTEIPDLMRTLDDELLRMINALEKLRELHRRGEGADVPVVVDAKE